MENKKPYEMKWLMVLYNAYQVLFCTWLCAQVNNLIIFFSNLLDMSILPLQAFQVNNYVQYIYQFVCTTAPPDHAFAYAVRLLI